MIVMQKNICGYQLPDVSLLYETRAKKILVKPELVQICFRLPEKKMGIILETKCLTLKLI